MTSITPTRYSVTREEYSPPPAAATAAPRLPRVAMRVLVAGESAVRSRLRAFLGGLPDVDQVFESCDGLSAIAAIRTRRPDVVFIAVHLPGLGGIDVVRAIGPERMPLLVLLAEREDHAIRAFEVEALDYLVTPLDDARCRLALDRARRRLAVEAAAAQHQVVDGLAGRLTPPEPVDRIAVKLQGRMVVVQVAEIDWLEARDNYVRIHVGTTYHLVRGKISTFEMRLDPRRFLRVHRGALVNVDRIAEVHSGLRGDVLVVLRTGVQVPVGSTRRDQLFQRIGHSIGG